MCSEVLFVMRIIDEFLDYGNFFSLFLGLVNEVL